MDKQQLLNDEQIRHFILNGYVNVTADVPVEPRRRGFQPRILFG